MAGSDGNEDDGLYDDEPAWPDEDSVRRRVTELGPEFDKLVTSVMGEMQCAQGMRDEVQVLLVFGCDRFSRGNIDGPAVRGWLFEVNRSAIELADLLERGAPFPEGSPQAAFSFVHDDLCLPDPYDVARLRKMASVAGIMDAAWAKNGAPRRVNRVFELIQRLADMYEQFSMDRATGKRPFRTVVELVFCFLGERRADNTLVRNIQKALKARPPVR